MAEVKDMIDRFGGGIDQVKNMFIATVEGILSNVIGDKIKQIVLGGEKQEDSEFGREPITEPEPVGDMAGEQPTAFDDFLNRDRSQDIQEPGITLTSDTEIGGLHPQTHDEFMVTLLNAPQEQLRDFIPGLLVYTNLYKFLTGREDNEYHQMINYIKAGETDLIDSIGSKVLTAPDNPVTVYLQGIQEIAGMGT